MIARLARLTALAALCALCLAPAAHAEEEGQFGLSTFQLGFESEDGSPASQAGSHPFALNTFFEVNRHEEGGQLFVDGGDIKDLSVTAPRGLIGDITAVPTCSTLDFSTLVGGQPSCANGTAVGIVAVMVSNPENVLPAPVYNLAPSPGVPLRLGFVIQEVPLVVDFALKQSPNYNVLGGPTDSLQPLTVFGAALQLWGYPADPAHDFARGHCAETALKEPLILDGKLDFKHGGPECSAEGAPHKPLLTLPRTCEALETSYALDSWSDPGARLPDGEPDLSDPAWKQGSISTGPLTGCDASKVPFKPQIASTPTTDSAQSASGLDFEIDFEDPTDPESQGLTDPGGIAQSDIEKTVVALPQGMTADPSLAEGLGVCTPADLKRETLAAAPGQGCPNASKIGTVSVDTPLVDEQIEGDVFIAQPDDPSTSKPGAENPFDSLVAFYIVLEDKNLGLLVKVPAKVAPDPRTGQLITTVEDIPQVPFARFRFHFREGQRAPLISPPACGTYQTSVQLTPWARPGETIERTASFQITHGPNGGPCPPPGRPPFHPGFEAGSLNNAAAHYSPFLMRMTRQDGEQDITRFSATLPPGELGKIAGIAKCPDAAIAAAKAKTGLAERANPSCPAGSLIGHVIGGAGVGEALTYVPGDLYLAGPYHGDPLSVVAIVPAVAGPFDVGTVVTRVALNVDPASAEVEVDGAASDPIPHILAGIPLNVRDLRVMADRPGFTLNPTSCAPSSTRASVFGSGLDPLSPADDAPIALSDRYQAADCASLGFKPTLSLKLRGGKRRGAFPALTATYAPRAGDANLRSLSLRLPRSEFIEQGHFRTICTRVQYASGPGNGAGCPPGSIYGHVQAFTPLLEEPLEGPVYERSSNHNLPDLIFALHGIVDAEVAVRIDSLHGGLRARIESSPDVPVTKAIVTMQGGQKGLIVNSTDICKKPHRAQASLVGHNGRLEEAEPGLVAVGCGKAQKR